MIKNEFNKYSNIVFIFNPYKRSILDRILKSFLKLFENEESWQFIQEQPNLGHLGFENS